MKESDLHAPCRNWLEAKGCEVRSEVNHVDMVGIFDTSCVVALEMKVTLNLEVINQAVERQKYADFVYIATVHNGKTVRNKRAKRTIETLKRLQVGWVTVDFKSDPPEVRTILEAKPFDFERSRQRQRHKKAALIEEFNNRSVDGNVAGSHQKKLMTAYREESLKIAYCLDDRGPLSPKALRALGCHEKKTGTILYKNYYRWFQRVEKGIYDLSEAGRQALILYEGMTPYLKSAVQEVPDD